MDDNLVAQGNDLVEAKHRDPLTVNEQKAILTIVSMISPDDKDFQVYSLGVRDFGEMLGVKGESIYHELKKIANSIVGKVIEIPTKTGFIATAWMSSVEYKKGEAIVEFSFDPKLRPYLLQLQNQFTTYRLSNILSLKSMYSIRLYELMKKWQKIARWEYPVEDLRDKLGANQKSYENYGSFKQKVLTPALSEINEFTDLHVTYREIRVGRRIGRIEFTIRTDADKEVKVLDNVADLKLYTTLNDLANFQISHKLFSEIYSVAEKTYKPYHIKKELITLIEMANEPSIQKPPALMKHIIKEQHDLVLGGMKATLQKASNEVEVDWMMERNEKKEIREWKSDATEVEVQAIYDKYRSFPDVVGN